MVVFRREGKARPIAVDLFAGAGGATLGLRRAGFDVPIAVEIDHEKSATLRNNHPGTIVLGGEGSGDVRSLSGRDILDCASLSEGDVDLLVACPPCQGFSLLGRRDPADERNDLFREVLRIAIDLGPSALVIENVPGMLSLAGGAAVAELRSALKHNGFSSTIWDLNAADFGAPQSRRRIFIVAVDGLAIPNPPSPIEPPPVTVWDAISDLPETLRKTRPPETVPLNYLRKPRSFYSKTLRGARTTVTNCEVTFHKAKLKRRFNRLRWGEVDRPTHHRRLHPNRPSPTITAGSRTRTACRPVHPYKDRVLTVREAARLAGFPDWYRFPAAIAEAWEEIGNCVPPPLAARVFGQVREVASSGRRPLWGSPVDIGQPRSRYVEPGPPSWTDRRLRAVVRRLSSRYHDPRHHNQDDPLDELIFIILSGQTTEESYIRTFAALKARFRSWSDALAAEPDELERVIAPGGLSRKKGNQIHGLLSEIEASRGALDLGFLRSMEAGAAERLLSALPGVGRKTAKCVTMYSLGRSSFPVDTHLRRVLHRLGIAKISRLDDQAQDFIERAIPPELRYKLHVNGLALGRDLCLPQTPRCSECPVSSLCDHPRRVSGAVETYSIQPSVPAESSV